ncbi:MAG: GTPase ObgE [Desulfobacterales bacterium]|nr:GTPase ObgE [Desulfobacterales bacterium]MBF0395358.1 GTPase ObgE [Desulfobacterales bacterium]
MKFIDEAIITVSSGSGGNGCVSFRREKFIPRGGPDGGDGGKGGDVILTATLRKQTLLDFKFKRDFNAQNGSGGSGKQRTGKDGKDTIIYVPVGTVVINSDTSEIIKDFTEDQEEFIAAKGGRGGCGNKHFATSTNRTPRFSQDGEEGETLNIKLELKLIAEVGIVGMPNAGKSTLLASISSAHPKIGDYPFTTLSPNLGVTQIRNKPIIIADIPGIIEGAHTGVGLGIKFLKHIERTKVLLHLIDASQIDESNPTLAYEIINKELSSYNESLIKKHQIIVLNKIDIEGAKKRAELFQKTIKDKKVILISAIQGEGISKLKSEIIKVLKKQDGS